MLARLLSRGGGDPFEGVQFAEPHGGPDWFGPGTAATIRIR